MGPPRRPRPWLRPLLIAGGLLCLILISTALTFALTRMPRVSKVAVSTTLAGVLAFIWTRPDGHRKI